MDVEQLEEEAQRTRRALIYIMGKQELEPVPIHLQRVNLLLNPQPNLCSAYVYVERDMGIINQYAEAPSKRTLITLSTTSGSNLNWPAAGLRGGRSGRPLPRRKPS